jgi:hypothetical protein
MDCDVSPHASVCQPNLSSLHFTSLHFASLYFTTHLDEVRKWIRNHVLLCHCEPPARQGLAGGRVTKVIDITPFIPLTLRGDLSFGFLASEIATHLSGARNDTYDVGGDKPRPYASA